MGDVAAVEILSRYGCDCAASIQNWLQNSINIYKKEMISFLRLAPLNPSGNLFPGSNLDYLHGQTRCRCTSMETDCRLISAFNEYHSLKANPSCYKRKKAQGTLYIGESSHRAKACPILMTEIRPITTIAFDLGKKPVCSRLHGKRNTTTAQLVLISA